MNETFVIPVDFGNRDDDGAVRLVTRGTTDYLRSHGIVLSEDLKVRMSDGEITAEGTCKLREGMWVAIVGWWSN
jgi:hypothetical protein